MIILGVIHFHIKPLRERHNCTGVYNMLEIIKFSNVLSSLLSHWRKEMCISAGRGSDTRNGGAEFQISAYHLVVVRIQHHSDCKPE